MPFSESGGWYNFRGSFNSAFLRAITASLPTWMTTARVYFDYPEAGVLPPAFAVTHIGPRERAVAGGYIVRGNPVTSGVEMQVITDVSCWVSRQSGTADNPSWSRDLLQMRDMVKFWANRNRWLSAWDIYSGTASPPQLSRIIRLEPGIEEQDWVGEPNPALARHRMLIKWRYVETW